MSEQNYHPALSPLSWLFGCWESIEAKASYPTMDSLKYEETVEFKPTLQPVIQYKSETIHALKKHKMHCETGFLRIDPESATVALLVSHNFGVTEVSEGNVKEKSLHLESKFLSRMSFSKSTAVTKIVRQLTFKDEKLCGLVLMETTNQSLQKHLECMYRKKEG